MLESLRGVLTRTRRSNRCSIEIYWGTWRTQRSNVVIIPDCWPSARQPYSEETNSEVLVVSTIFFNMEKGHEYSFPLCHQLIG